MQSAILEKAFNQLLAARKSLLTAEKTETAMEDQIVDWILALDDITLTLEEILGES